jgi:hypothetical protein
MGLNPQGIWKDKAGQTIMPRWPLRGLKAWKVRDEVTPHPVVSHASD